MKSCKSLSNDSYSVVNELPFRKIIFGVSIHCESAAIMKTSSEEKLIKNSA